MRLGQQVRPNSRCTIRCLKNGHMRMMPFNVINYYIILVNRCASNRGKKSAGGSFSYQSI
jgi:hypothetical protein